MEIRKLGLEIGDILLPIFAKARADLVSYLIN
jgi:hypothetical protein